MTDSRLSRRAFFGRAATAPLAGAGAARHELPSQGWIIAAVSWEYNDQFTYEVEGVQLQPKVYLDRSAAEAECRRQCAEFFTQVYPTPESFEPDWELFPNCDPDTATWDDLRHDGFPDPYFIQEVELTRPCRTVRPPVGRRARRLPGGAPLVRRHEGKPG